MILDHKRRWVFSPLGEPGAPLAAEYANQWEAPLHYNGFALVYCVMNAHQLAAAKQDPRLIVLDSLHLLTAIPDKVAAHHAAHGLAQGMTLAAALACLAKQHPSFDLPE